MRKILFALSMVASVVLCSCSGAGIRYEISAYRKELPYKDNFNICMLGDIHLSTMTNMDSAFAQLNRVIYSYNSLGTTKPDMLVLNGDTFMDADKTIVKKAIDYFDGLDIPFAFTYGNHDTQGLYTPNYINSLLLKTTNGLYLNPENDDVYGNGNSVVDLVDPLTHELKWQVYLMDSNTYVNMKYDVIHDDQIAWYERTLLESNGYSEKPSVITKDTFKKSICFFHIPTPEFTTAFNDFKANPAYSEGVSSIGDEYCVIHESISSGYRDTNLIPLMQEYRSTVGIGVSHDHVNNTDLWYQGDTDWPVRLIYGEKATTEIYYEDGMVGACFFTLFESPKTSSLDNSHTLYFNLTRVSMDYDGTRKVLWQNQW